MQKIYLLLIFAVGLSGCSYLTPWTVSTTHLDPENEIPLGIVRGKAVNSYLLGFIPTGYPEDMRTAMNRAKLEIGADNLINVYVDKRVTYYPMTLLPLYTKYETIVYGTGIRYKDRSSAKIKDFTVPEPPTPQPVPTPPKSDRPL